MVLGSYLEPLLVPVPIQAVVGEFLGTDICPRSFNTLLTLQFYIAILFV